MVEPGETTSGEDFGARGRHPPLIYSISIFWMQINSLPAGNSTKPVLSFQICFVFSASGKPCQGSIQTNCGLPLVFCQIMQYGKSFVWILMIELSLRFLKPTQSEVIFVKRCPLPKPDAVTGMKPGCFSP